MKVEEIEKALSAARQKQAEIKVEIAAVDAKAGEMKNRYRAAVEAGETDEKLDGMDKEIYQLDRLHTRAEIRLSQCGSQIEQLFRDREEAHALEDRLKYEEDAKAALAEAAEIESIVQGLIGRASSHWQRLQRMKQFCEAAGIPERSYKLANLERRISAIFRNGSVNRAFEQTYPQILAGNIASVEKQRNKTTPESEPAPAQETNAELN
jgi:hypothetical protein